MPVESDDKLNTQSLRWHKTQPLNTSERKVRQLLNNTKSDWGFCSNLNVFLNCKEN